MKVLITGLFLIASLPSFASYKIICKTGYEAGRDITTEIDMWSNKGYEVKLISFESKIVGRNSSSGLSNRDCAVIKVKKKIND